MSGCYLVVILIFINRSSYSFLMVLVFSHICTSQKAVYCPIIFHMMREERCCRWQKAMKGLFINFIFTTQPCFSPS